MSNTFFQFKQFTVQQNACAMKVCTDACLFGAWAADVLQPKQPGTVLDIGAGTGLLSLMLAQKITATIQAVELDAAACAQAKENFAASPWGNRVQAVHADVLTFEPAQQYDCIITNPPFFENDLPAVQQNKNAAKHDTALTLLQLLQQVKRLLKDTGSFIVLLPYHRTESFISSCGQQQLFCNAKVLVKQTPQHPYFRSMLWFTAANKSAITEQIIIKENNQYTAAFTQLLQPYYLHL